MPIAEQKLQRLQGDGRIGLKLRDGLTCLEKLHQRGAAKIRLPSTQSEALEAVLINTAGGLTGGDQLNWSINLADETTSLVTTQACEKIYKSAGGVAEVNTAITLGAHSCFSWVPQETILYNKSALSRRLTVHMQLSTKALLVEPFVFGRQAMGEFVKDAHFTDKWLVTSDGVTAHAEALSLSGDIEEILKNPNVSAGRISGANIVLFHPQALDFVAPLRTLMGEAGTCSAWQVARTPKLSARILAEDGFNLRKCLIPVLEWLLKRVHGQKQTLPKVWNL